MKIDSKKLSEFIEKTTLQGVINGGTIFVKKNKIHSILKNGSAIMTIGELKTKSDKEFEIHVKDMKFLKNALKSFEGLVEVDVKENKLLIFNKTSEAEITLSDPKFIENWNSEKIPEDLVFKKSFKTTSDIFKKASENYGYVSEGNLLLKIENKMLSLSVGEDGFDKLIVKTPININENIRCEFGKIFLDICKILEGEIELVFNKSDYPIKLIKRNEETTYEFLIAPFVEHNQSDEDEEEKKEEKPENDSI